MWEAHCSTDGGFQQFVTTTHQMRQTLLVPSLFEVVVHAPAVVNQHAGPGFAQKRFRWLTTSRRINHVIRQLLRDEVVQPGRATVHTPPGFVNDDSRRAAYLLSNQLVRRSQFRRQPLLSPPVGTPRDRDAEQLIDQPSTLSVREAQLLISNRQCRLQVRTQLTGRRSQSVRRLQLMPPLNTTATAGAVPVVNVKLTIDRLSRNVRLVLLADGVLGQLATAALRTALRQRNSPVLIDLLRDHSPCLRPIIVTRLAA